MKIARIFVVVAVLAIVAASVSAQTRPAATPAAPPASQATVAVPDSKIAMIYSDAFMDPKTGIAKFSTLLNTLNREFQPRQTELQGLQTRINTLTKEINDTQSVADPNTIRTKRDQLDQLNTEFKQIGRASCRE